ncbi:carbohydrate ABC transporter permease [Paenibacillus cymbidii]|uniref:carbohydrate ABC transporter permease n=1 Tax=Paenibacillus cymbidii TaxID=1639034 RepID=UPI001436795F|nr:carbohydrate ABC transporter permease [Paenibacillus cymbidii]
MSMSMGEKWFQWLNYFFLLLIAIGSVFPFLYIISVSLTPLADVMKHGGFILIPRHVTFEAYSHVFTRTNVPRSMLNSLYITFFGTILSTMLTLAMGYGLAKREVPGKNVYVLLVVFTIVFSGGIIPSYLIVKYLGLLNSLWSIILSFLISPFNLLIAKAFLEQLPQELEESTEVDGAGELTYFLKIVIPLSKPVIATLSLFNAVFFWNMYFYGALYITKQELLPLQVALKQLIASPDPSLMMGQEMPLSPETLIMAGVVVSTLPIAILYPFLQKYFIKGATLGAVKG